MINYLGIIKSLLEYLSVFKNQEKALQARNASGDFVPISFKPFEEAYKACTEKLQPMVYELGFLRV